MCKFLFTGRDKVTVPSHHQSPPDAETCQGNSVYHFIITALLHKSYHDASNDDSNQLLTSSLTASRRSILSEELPLEFEECPDLIELFEESLESEEDLESSLDAISE